MPFVGVVAKTLSFELFLIGFCCGIYCEFIKVFGKIGDFENAKIFFGCGHL
jgi:hypothetical protein